MFFRNHLLLFFPLLVIFYLYRIFSFQILETNFSRQRKNQSWENQGILLATESDTGKSKGL